MIAWARDRAHSVVIANNAKLWTNIAYGVSTYKIWITPLRDISSEMFLIWLAIVAGVELAKRALAAKLGVTSEEPKPDDDPCVTPPPKPTPKGKR